MGKFHAFYNFFMLIYMLFLNPIDLFSLYYIRYGVGYQNVQFRVVAEEEDNPNLVTLIPNITMDNKHVQLLTAPMWLPSSNSRFPANAGDVATASGPCVKDENGPKKQWKWKCRVHLGVEESEAARKHLGFSFLAIGSNVSSDVALSGSVEMRDGYKVDSDSSTLSPGVTAHESFTDSPGGNFSFYAGEGAKHTCSCYYGP